MCRFCFGRHMNVLGDDGMDELLFSGSAKARVLPDDELKKATNNFSKDRLIGRCLGNKSPSMSEVMLMLESLDGGSNSLSQPPIHLHTPQTDDTSYSTYISAASSFRSSTTTTEYLEDEGNTSISEGEGNVTLTELESADSDTELQVQGEQLNTSIVSVVTLTDIESADYNTELPQAQGESFGRKNISTDTSKPESSQGVDPSKGRTSTDKYRSNSPGVNMSAKPESSQEARPFKFDPATRYRSKSPGVKRFIGARV